MFGWDEYPLINHWPLKRSIPAHNLLQMRACSIVKNMPFIVIFASTTRGSLRRLKHDYFSALIFSLTALIFSSMSLRSSFRRSIFLETSPTSALAPFDFTEKKERFVS